MSQQTDDTTVYCRQCGTALKNPSPGQKAVICPCCGAAYMIHDPHAGWLRRKWELLQFRRSRQSAALAKSPVEAAVPRGKRKILGAIVCFLAAAALTAGMPRIQQAAGNREFRKLQTSSHLPVPDFPIEKLVHDDKDWLSVHFQPVTKSQMMDFFHDCEKMGYEMERIPGSYKLVLFSDDGWSLELNYLESMKRLYLSLEEPKPLDVLDWIDVSIPKPNCKYAYTYFHTGKKFLAYVSPMDHDQWSMYADQLMAEGFIYELTRYPSSFSAKAEDGTFVSAEYHGNEVVEISTSKP